MLCVQRFFAVVGPQKGMGWSGMQIEIRSIKEIRPYEHNPRNNDGAVDAVAASIKEFGWQQPIVVDKDGVIIAGHTRYKAAKKLGLKEVPVVVAENLTDEQVKAYRLADNKNLFVEADSKEKEAKEIKCPHCGMYFTP